MLSCWERSESGRVEREGGRHFAEECSWCELPPPTLGLWDEELQFSIDTYKPHDCVGPLCLHLHIWETKAG